MLYVIAYVIIGLVFAGVTGRKHVLSAAEDNALAGLLTFFLIGCTGAMFWPMLLAGLLARKLTGKEAI